MPPRLLIAEDEDPLRKDLIERIALLWPEATVVADVGDGMAALDAAEAQEVDVAFLDVRMPGLSGLEVARQLSGRCHVVFVTAYDDAAVAAFDADAVDYVLKPVGNARLRQTIERVKKRLASAPPNLDDVLAALADAAGHAPLRWVQASNGRAIEFIPVASVAYFQAEEKYTTVRTGGRELLIRTSLKELLTQLDPASFWQIHRSTIVNIDFIDRVERQGEGELLVRVKGLPDLLRVSRSFRGRFRYM